MINASRFLHPRPASAILSMRTRSWLGFPSSLRSLSSSGPVSPVQEIHFPRPHKWNRAVSEAENLVGFPTSLLSLRSLLNDDVSSMATHMRKLMGSDHPILKTLKRLFYHEKNNLQVRGLLILLIARSLNKKTSSHGISDLDEETGISLRQRKLAEYVEMIYSAQAIHRSVLNLPLDFHDSQESEEKEDLLRLEYGNKIAILGGDYLLANACTGLADLRNTYVVEMISLAIADFTQSEFLGERDVQGRFVPTEQFTTLESWLHRNTLACGNLMSNGCKSVAMLAGLESETQESGRRVGHNLSLALQAYSEIQPFCDDSSVNHREPLDLSGAPVIFHMQNDPEMLRYVQGCKGDLEKLDFKQIFDAVKSGSGIQMTQELCNAQADEALKIVNDFDDLSAKSAIVKIISYLKSN